MPCRFSGRESQLHMIPEVPRDPFKLPLITRCQQIALYVTSGEAHKQIQRAIENEQPGEKEVPTPAGGEILKARNSRPTREAPFSECSVRIL